MRVEQSAAPPVNHKPSAWLLLEGLGTDNGGAATFSNQRLLETERTAAQLRQNIKNASHRCTQLATW